MTAYTYEIYWKESWMPKIYNPNVYPLEHYLIANGQLTTLPGLTSVPGFSAGDSIRFSFINPSGLKLTSSNISFKTNTPGAPTNPLGIADANGTTQNGIWTMQCTNFVPSSGDSELFQTDDETSFDFINGDSSWVIAVEAIYTVPPPNSVPTLSFRFDPEWMVGNG